MQELFQKPLGIFGHPFYVTSKLPEISQQMELLIFLLILRGHPKLPQIIL